MKPQTLTLSLIAAVALVASAVAQSPFPTPADVRRQVVAEEAYRWKIIDKLRTSRFQADVSQKERITVVRIVIARDGRLLDAQVVGSSGLTEIDHNILAALRQGSPYAPLPPEIPGESASFRLRLASVPEH
jgi:protein TonB